MRRLMFCLIVLVCGHGGDKVPSDGRGSADGGQAKKIGEEYLRKVMSRLQSEKRVEEGYPVAVSESMDSGDADATAEAVQEAGSPALQAEIVADASVPEIPQGLTPEELKSIYNYAAAKLANLSLWQNSIKPISHFHHPPPPPPPAIKNLGMKPAPPPESAAGIVPGYYYHYYPIKSFVGTVEPKPVASPPNLLQEATKPVQMQATVTMTDASSKSVEPLFMAISGFIGMALMFIISVLFVPKFGKLRSGEANPPNSRHDLLVLGRLVFDSMEGKDCGKRLACEIGRILRGAKMDDKPLRVLEIILPPKFGNQIGMIRRTAAKRERCTSIPCKLREPEGSKPEKQKKKSKRKPWKTPESEHHLWNKRFENRTRFRQPENIWERNRPGSPRAPEN